MFEYEVKDIHSCIQDGVSKHVKESLLKEQAMLSVDFKMHEFLFSKVTYAHALVWGNDMKQEDLVRLMASMELYILATDILDDLQDQDNTTVPWMTFENKYAMSLVFMFLSLSKEMIHETSFSHEVKLSLLHTLGTYEFRSLSGQHDDLQKKWMTEEDYLNMIDMKAGSIMSLASLLGSVSASHEEKERIAEYAIHVGCSAQIENDLAGITEKQQFKDIVAKEISLPIIYLLNYKKEEILPLYDYYMGNIDKTELQGYFPHIKDYILKSGSVHYSRTLQLIHLEKASIIIKELYVMEEDRQLIQGVFFKRT